MKIVRDKVTKIAIYIFNDSDDVRIGSDGMHGPTRATDIKPAKYEIIESVTDINFFFGRAFKYDLAWELVSPELITIPIADIQNALISVVEIRSEEEQNKPMMVGTIPVRNHKEDLAEIHGMSVRDVANRAWKIADGEYISITILEAKAIREAVHDRRQGSRNNARDLSNSIKAAVDVNAFNAIDLKSGWPTV